MLVTLKTLQEDIFTVDIDPSQTVKSFKEKIEKAKGLEFPAKNMKLMYAGKILIDNKKLCEYNVEEKKFVIVVIKKPKATIVKEEPEPESSEMGQERSNFMNGQRNADETLVNQLVELGFSRAEVEAALNASYNNPDRAVEYLLSEQLRIYQGALPSSSNEDAETEARRRNPDHIADSSDARLARQLSSTGPPSPGSGRMPNREQIMQIYNEAIDESRNRLRATERQLEQDRDLINQTFAEMESELGRSGASSSLLSTFVPGVGGMPAGMPPGMSGVPAGMMGMPDSAAFESFNSAFHEANALGFAGNLMDRDHEAIERLKQLGFSDQKAIEAYFVCERNENAAADYLFSQNFE